MDKQKLAEFLVKKRGELGKSVEEVAGLLNVNTLTIQRWESGENTPRKNQLRKALAVYNISREELLQYTGLDIGADRKENVLPLVKMVAEARLEKLSMDELVYLVGKYNKFAAKGITASDIVFLLKFKD